MIQACGSLAQANHEAKQYFEIERALRRGSGVHFRYDVEHRDMRGKLLWSEKGIPNIIMQEGEEALLSAYFDTDLAGFGAPPANLYMGLRTNASADTDTLASGLTEVSGTGYSRIANATTTGWALSNVSSIWRATTGNNVFTAGGTWTTAVALFICTVSSGTSGKLISSATLSTNRTLVNGDTLTCTAYLALSN
jgi:hypothetical protein